MTQGVYLVAPRESVAGLAERLTRLEGVATSGDIDDDPGPPVSLDAILNPNVTVAGTATIRRAGGE